MGYRIDKAPKGGSRNPCLVWLSQRCFLIQSSAVQRAIDMGFVCSVCLSIFCEVSNWVMSPTSDLQRCLFALTFGASLPSLKWHSQYCWRRLLLVYMVAFHSVAHPALLRSQHDL